MFDDLRKEGDSSPFFQGAEMEPLLDAPKKKSGGVKLKVGRNFLGMTAFQRFVVSALLLVMVTFAGFALLLLAGTIDLSSILAVFGI